MSAVDKRDRIEAAAAEVGRTRREFINAAIESARSLRELLAAFDNAACRENAQAASTRTSIAHAAWLAAMDVYVATRKEPE